MSSTMRSLVHKRFSLTCVLTALLVTNARVAFADDLPPPPPPPPGANPTQPPAAPSASNVLEAPPPPPPGVDVEPPPNVPPTTPPTPSTAKPTAPILAPPPTPPPGTDVAAPEPKPTKVEPPTRLSRPVPRANTVPDYRPDDQPRQTTRGTWYGWKSLIGLVPVYALFIGGIVSEETTLFIPAVIGGALITPVAHWSHGNKRKGWLSFGLNFGVPALGGIVGGGYGALVGLGLWNVVDMAALHYETKPVPAAPIATNILQSIAIVPMMGNGRTGLTLMGQF